jgi:hypothetical protein
MQLVDWGINFFSSQLHTQLMQGEKLYAKLDFLVREKIYTPPMY